MTWWCRNPYICWSWANERSRYVIPLMTEVPSIYPHGRPCPVVTGKLGGQVDHGAVMKNSNHEHTSYMKKGTPHACKWSMLPPVLEATIIFLMWGGRSVLSRKAPIKAATFSNALSLVTPAAEGDMLVIGPCRQYWMVLMDSPGWDQMLPSLEPQI